MSIDPLYHLDSYDYLLPEAQIAQSPALRRDDSRLLVLDCVEGERTHRRFADLCALLAPGDLLVTNNTRVFPARLLGRKESGGKVELFLLEYPAPLDDPADPDGQMAELVCLIKSGKAVRPGQRLFFSEGLAGEVLELLPQGGVRAVLRCRGRLIEAIERHGQVPLPPYIQRKEGQDREDSERYQTVYASCPGAVAAPTAGLHFTPELLRKISEMGVCLAELTLHVGYGTFAPVRVSDIREHRIHAEYVSVPQETAELINARRAKGGRIWAVGTTSARALEWAADASGRVGAKSGMCGLYIYPGYRFRVVENLVTNFHLPKSSLLFLVSALVGKERVLAAYREAVTEGYRFYSYGDAMALITRHPRPPSGDQQQPPQPEPF